jgi:predicted DsbA family dithiol-disulfide isomerase
LSKKKVRIDLISDVVCPWCIIGYKRLEKALDMVKGEIEADVHWHPFELNPDMPEGGENLRSHLANKYGTTLEGSIKARENLTHIGADLGFKFDYFDEMKMFNTFKAHQILHFASENGKGNELRLRLFSAFFGERKEIDQTDALVAEAVSVGLNEAESRKVLESEKYADIVRAEEKEWRTKGVQSVPTFIFNETQGVSGAYPPEDLAEILKNL